MGRGTSRRLVEGLARRTSLENGANVAVQIGQDVAFSNMNHADIRGHKSCAATVIAITSVTVAMDFTAGRMLSAKLDAVGRGAKAMP